MVQLQVQSPLAAQPQNLSSTRVVSDEPIKKLMRWTCWVQMAVPIRSACLIRRHGRKSRGSEPTESWARRPGMKAVAGMGFIGRRRRRQRLPDHRPQSQANSFETGVLRSARFAAGRAKQRHCLSTTSTSDLRVHQRAKLIHESLVLERQNTRQ